MANLVLNGRSIDTIDEIAENFVEEDVLREFKSGSLAAWLEEYDYSDELDRVKSIKTTASNARIVTSIADALNLDDDVIAENAARREEQQRKEEEMRKAQEEKRREESEEERGLKDEMERLNQEQSTQNQAMQNIVGQAGVYHVDELKDIPKWENDNVWFDRVSDWDVAFKGYLNAARNGNPFAYGRLAYCYSNGLGTGQDFDQCLYWASKGAECFDPLSCCELASCFWYGFGVRRNLAEAVRYYRLAAEIGDEDALMSLTRIYDGIEGGNVFKDVKQAFELLMPVAMQGSAWAQVDVGRRYFCGNGVVRNCETAVKWFRKAAEQGYPTAQLNLGICYCIGVGVCKDSERGRAWANKAAEQGFDVAVVDMVIGAENGKTDILPEIDGTLCKGCSMCAKQCPSGAISGVGKIRRIDAALCTRCGICHLVCPYGSFSIKCVVK